MSKAVRWQVPFVSTISKTQYRVDIYDEDYSGDPIQLIGGPSPFTTDEESDKNIFTPVRGQTGTLEILTKTQNGETITMDDIIPANNIDRPVRLIKINNSTTPATETIEWQGFLSCEAYSQDYTAIPQVLSVPLLSVLSAMESVQLDNSRSNGFVTLNVATYNILKEVEIQCGLTCFTHVRYSMTSWRIFEKYINQMIFFDLKEQNTETSVNMVIDAKSAKESLSMLCTLMGWTAREQGTEIFLEYIGENIGMYQETLTNFGTNFHQQGTPAAQIVTGDIEDFEWMGNGHQRSVSQGAKSVEVVADIKKYEVEIGLPEFPEENMVHATSAMAESYITKDTTFSNMLSFSYFAYQNDREHATYDNNATLDDAYADCALNPDCNISAQYPYYTTGQSYYCNKHLGAFFSKVKQTGDDDFVDGLYVVAANQMDASLEPPTIFTMRSILHYAFVDGYLEFKLDAQTIRAVQQGGSAALDTFIGKAHIIFKFGDKYYTGSSWTTTRTVWVADMQDAEDFPAFKIPVTEQLQGEIVIELLGTIIGGTNGLVGGVNVYYPYYDLFIKELSLTHKRDEAEYTYADRNSNHYIQLLGTNFRDEVTVNTDLATSLNNKLSPSLIMDTNQTPVSEIEYTISEGTESRKPEKDLLRRLANFYQKSRQRLKLFIKHPQTFLSILQLNGIDDGKVYLPLAESRDWKQDISTLTCFEIGEQTPSES